MGKLKKERNRIANTGGNAEKAGNLRVKGENFYRDAKKVKYVNMLKGGTAIRNAKGEIVRAADYQSTETPTARIAPNRKWFGKDHVDNGVKECLSSLNIEPLYWIFYRQY